jgi:hypothetical protein
MASNKTSFTFHDFESNDDGWMKIERSGDIVSIVISLQHGSDVEFFLTLEDANRMAEVLARAIDNQK